MKINTRADLDNLVDGWTYMVMETGEIVDAAQIRFGFDGVPLTVETYSYGEEAF